MSVGGGRMRIGEVHALLRQDHPDIELSKIRYYEDKGLVRPGRSRKGYRLYSDRDVACLREAIRLAQEEFVPLRVVRVRLVEQGLLDDTPAATTRQVAREATASVVVAPVPDVSRPALAAVPDDPAPPRDAEHDGEVASDQLRVAEFLARLDLDAVLVNHLVSVGLIAPTNHDGETVFSALDLRVAQAAGDLVGRGVDVRFLGALRRIVDRELGVIEDLTEPLRAPGSRLSPDETRRVVVEVAGEVGVLRSVLMERALGSYLAE